LEFSDTSVSRYIQLAMLFRRRVRSGYWKVGEQIPTVRDLALEFQVAKGTIRQALSMLESEGLIVRLRAKGTFVQPQKDDFKWCKLNTEWAGLQLSREGATIEVLSEQTGPLPIVPPHNFGALAETYRHLQRRHWFDGQPYLVADVYLDVEYADALPKEAFTSYSALRLASTIAGREVVVAHQALSVEAAEVEIAELLQIPINSPVCFIDLSGADRDGRLIILSRGTYRGDVVKTEVLLSANG
jgi:GntR family transcriptional regulator